MKLMLFLLKHTDICQHAIDALQKNKIKRVILMGRRGPMEVAFTIKELREMMRLNGTRPVLHPEDFEGVRERIPGNFLSLKLSEADLEN